MLFLEKYSHSKVWLQLTSDKKSFKNCFIKTKVFVFIWPFNYFVFHFYQVFTDPSEEKLHGHIFAPVCTVFDFIKFQHDESSEKKNFLCLKLVVL